MTPASFTPEQAKRLTGVSPQRQREWRKQGLLPPNEGGWTRYDLAGLCRLYLLNALASSKRNKLELKSAAPAVDAIAAKMAADIEALVAEVSAADIEAAPSPRRARSLAPSRR